MLKFDKRWQMAVSKGSIQVLLQNLQETVNVKRKVDPLEPSGARLQGGVSRDLMPDASSTYVPGGG